MVHEREPMSPDPVNQKSKEPRRRKIPLACEPCRERKSRCDGEKPICAACARRKLPIHRCVYTAENARSASSNEYIRTLHQRIRELEAGSGLHPSSGNSSASTIVSEVPAEVDAGTAEVAPSQPGSLESLMVGSEYQHTLLRSQGCQAPGPSSAQAHASGSVDSPSTITGMGAMTTVHDNNQVSSQNSEYFGGSSAASLMCLLAGGQRQWSRHAWASQKIPPLDPVSDRQIGGAGMTSWAQMEGFVLPPRDLADHLLDCFWERVFCLYPFFDRQSFQRAYENLWVPKSQVTHDLTDLNVGLGDRFNSGPNSIIFSCALNTIFALGCHFSKLPPQDREIFTNSFFLRAKRHIGLDLVDIHSIGVVQTLLIVALFLQSTPYPHRCWSSIGMACRLALGLGLHEPQLESSKDPLEQEIHRRTWHGCVIMDITVGMTYGRPTMTSHLARTPLPGMFDLTSDAESGSSPLIAFYTSTIELYSILDGILSDVYKTWHGRSNDSMPVSRNSGLDVLLRLEDQLLQFESAVPQFLSWKGSWKGTLSEPPRSATEETIARQRNVLHSRCLYHKLLLYRPMLTQLCFDEQPDESRYHTPSSHSVLLCRWAAGCIQAAMDLVSLIHETYKSSATDTWWYNGFYTSTAAMILILSYSCYKTCKIELSSVDTAWQKVEEILQHLASFSVSGRNTFNFLQAMRNRFVSHLNANQSAPRDSNVPHLVARQDESQGDMSESLLEPWPPVNWDEGLSTNQFGFLGPLDISEMQSWFPEAGL